MKIVETTFTVNNRGWLKIPTPVIAGMGLKAGNHVRVAYLTHDSAANTFCELMLLPNAVDETASEKSSVISVPLELMQQAGISQNDDLQVACLDGCIMISQDTGFHPEELRSILENLQAAESLACMMPEEAQQVLAKLEQTIQRIQKEAGEDE